MAELYEKPKLYANAPAGVTPISGDPDLDKVLAELPPEEREEAMRKITAPPTGEEIARAMIEKNANGEMFNMNLEQYRLLKAHNKNKEVDIISTFGQAAGGIYDELTKAAESVVNNPADALAKVTPSLIEAFAQGTRNLYGMAAQSADPTSVMFRMKNALSANGSDEEAEYRQFMEAQQFNIHSMNLMSGKETLIMDKDVINPEMTQVMSYVADPTLFVPFGGIAAKGARIIGMGEGLAKASARASAIRNKVLGGTLKWGVGAPIEFLGNATRNTIDYGLERSATAFEFATGMPAAEAQATARMYGLNSVAGSLAGQTVPLPIVGNVAGAMVGATTAQGVGEAIGMLGEQMIKQQKHGRGVLSYAGQALRDSEKAGVQLSAHAKGLLRVIDMADPLFVYGADIAEGAGTGMVIGGGLGYLAGGEEGMASGAGAGFALGAVGAGLGSVTADVTNNRLYDRIAIQRKMVVEGLKGIDDAKASAFEGYVKAAEATGDRRYMAEVDGMIAGIDLMSPNSKWNIRTEAEHTAWLKSLKIDPKTGRLVEETAILPQFGSDRKQRASALSFLSMVSDNFSGLPENLLQHIDTLPADHAMRKHWARLSDDVKQAVLAEVKQSGDIEYRKKFGSKKSNQYYGDINYAEAHTARINSLFDSGNPTQARERINMLLKEETVGGKLTERGKALKDKLATEGYFDKDGNMRPSRLKDVELTENEYRNVAGFVLRRDSTGQVEVNLNINNMGKVTGLHELFHAIMLDSPMKDEFVDRLSTKLLGKFDANGKRIEGASVDTNQIKKFFQRYIDSKYRNDPQERANEVKRLERAIEEYEQRGDQNKVNRTTETTLEHMVEEFGAFYFPKFIQDKPVDYLFRGGELGAMREMFHSVKFGWLDFWRSKMGSVNPEFNADAIQGNKISQAFGKDGQPRYKNKALDLFMSDFVKATAMANRNGNFDLSRLSNEGQKTFIKNNGIRGYGTIDKDGKVVRLNRRSALREEMRVGKEIYKIVAGLDPKLRQGLTLDGEGNFSGRVSPELADALVASGHVDRAWVDKLLRAYDIIDGKESNVIEFGSLCRTAQIGDYAWPRLVGADVPFKNRTAILLDVDFKIGKDGRMSALYHTLDHAVIEGRANAIWSDPAIRTLWDGSRTAMEADFFRYLSNASLPADHPERVSSMKLLEDGTGKGAMRRNALHQMLGMAKLDGDVYINKPIAEIPLGIRHSVTTFNIDGISGLRVRQGMRYDYNHRNAFRDLSRNFMMSEMDTENTPNGKILKHSTGYKITKMAGTNRFSVFDPEGKELGRFDSLPDAGRAAQKHYNQTFDAKVEGKDVPVPRTEIPPSRQAYIDREFGGITDNIAGGTEKFIENLNVLLDRITEAGGELLNGENSKSALRIKKSIEERGNVTLSELKEIVRIGNDSPLIDTKRLPYYDYSYFWELIGNTIDKNYNRLGQQYDNMYPMEIKSALHGRLAQIMQDYPNLTAQGLLKKLDVYGSQGYRYLQEAREIGLVDLLKSKIKPRTEIYRKMDAQGNFTGEVATREIAVEFRKIAVEMKDSEGNVLMDKDGYPVKELRETTENISGTQPVLDMQEILDFAKSKEIKVTIEEGARELNKMNTERITLGGDKSNYKETAIRINPEYAHGVQGHYGENTIVHFRTTERLDAEGNRVLFIEEVQANNTDDIKRSKTNVLELKESLSILNDFKKNGLDEGILVIQGRGNLETALSDLLDGKQGNNPYLYNKHSESIYNTIVNYLHGGDGYAVGKETIKQSNRIRNSIDDIIYEYHQKGVKITEDELFSRLSDELLEEDYDVINGGIRANRPKAIFDYIEKAIELNDKYVDFIDKYSSKGDNVISSIGTYENITNIAHRLDEVISDLTTGINQATMSERGYPLTSAKDWTLSALKGIIRQAIRDGLDTITLTHPDDSPIESNMKPNARKGLYGKTIPEVWGAWLRKYGIEISQQNKMIDASMEFHKNALAEISGKYSDATEKVMDRFKQVYTGEDASVIQPISEFLSKPIHELRSGEISGITEWANKGIKDVQLKQLIDEAIMLRSAQEGKYSFIQKLREDGIRGNILSKDDISNTLRKSGKAAISAEAIDRGMTFKLNDAIKRDFLDGNIKTHMMMSEGEDIYAGGRTYNQNSKKWKSGFIGLWAEENPDRLKGYNIEFFQKEAGAYRIRLQDNLVKGRTVDVGHITAVVSGDTATISSKIADEYQGNKLSYALYSEMAERLRAMGIRRVDGQIVNRDGVPIRVRERIIGDTRDYFSGKPIDQIEGAIRIREKQAQFGNMAGVDVYNRLDPNARYMMAEGSRYEGEKRIKQAAEKAWGMPIIEDATIAGVSSKKGYEGEFKSQSLLRGAFESARQYKEKTESNVNKFGWKLVDGKKVFDRKQYERNADLYEEKRAKFLKYLEDNGGIENVINSNSTFVLDVIKGKLKEHGIDKETNWYSPDGNIRTVKEMIDLQEFRFNEELKENENAVKIFEEAKSQLDEDKLSSTFQTGKPIAVKAYHGSPYGEIKGNSFAPEMLGKYTKAASAKNAYFFAGSERTSGAYIEGGKMSSFDAKVPYDGWLELDYTERDAVENALRELYQEYKKGGGRASEDSYAQSLINDKYQFRELVDATLGTETFSTEKIKKGQVFPFFVKFDNPLVFDQGGESYREKSYFDLIQQAKKEGRDGVIILDTKDGGEYDIIYAVLPSYEGNIKSAKPRTYDDSGKQIPIKQRFDTSSKDIRKQPAEGWRDWQSERTSVGSVIKNTAGYVIMVQKGKFKVYNPYKAMVGIYDNEEQAKRRVQKDEPRR